MRKFVASSSFHLALIFLSCCLLMAPAFLFGARGSDVIYHSIWVKEFSAQLWHGNLYPRWLMDSFAGRGSPAFFYYPPLAYYVTSLFAPLFPLDPFAYDAMSASAWLALLAAGCGFYYWMRQETGNGNAALLGSLVYIAAPWEVAWNFYYSFLFSSFWAYAWMPLLMLSAKRLSLGKPNAVAAFALTLGLLILTSIPLTVICGPFAVAYAVLHFSRRDFIRQGLRLSAAVVLGFGLSAAFILPAVCYMHYAMVESLWNARGGYDFRFLRLGFNIPDQTMLTLTLLATVALAAAYGFLTRLQRRDVSFFCAAAILGVLMTLRLSKPVWDHVHILRILEAPVRFLGMPSLALAALVSLSYPRLRWAICGLIAFYGAVTFITVRELPDLTPDSLGTVIPYKYDMYQLNIEQYYNYLSSPDLVVRYYSDEGLDDVKKHPDKVEVIRGNATAQATRWEPRDIRIRYSAKTPSTLRVRQFDYPGFEAFEGGVALQVRREAGTGEILLDVPAAEGEISLMLIPLIPEQIGKIISFFSAAAILLMVLAAMRSRPLMRT